MLLEKRLFLFCKVLVFFINAYGATETKNTTNALAEHGLGGTLGNKRVSFFSHSASLLQREYLLILAEARSYKYSNYNTYCIWT